MAEVRSRLSRTERQRAMHIAKNCKESKFGTTLLEDNIMESRLLERQLERLEREKERLTQNSEQVKNMFVKERNNKQGPLMIIERPPPEVISDVLMFRNVQNDHQTTTPGYMKPLKSKIKPRSHLHTLDAFSATRSRTANVWEAALRGEHCQEVFRSAVTPSTPLSLPELTELQRGWRMHRPWSHPGNIRGHHWSHRQGVLPHRQEIFSHRRQEARAHQHDNRESQQTSRHAQKPFITHLAHYGEGKVRFGEGADKLRRSKTVHFAEDLSGKKQAWREGSKGDMLPIWDEEKETEDDYKKSLRQWLRETTNVL